MTGTTKVILLKGDPNKPESAEHIIKFPGGAISVTRTSNNEYWAHILVNKKQVSDQIGVVEGKHGDIIESRLDYEFPYNQKFGIAEIEQMENLEHIAIRIKTSEEVK